MMGELNGAPLWGNHCWICGHDVIAELKDKNPVYFSTREFKPWKDKKSVILDTKVYRYIFDGDAWRIEIGEYKGLKVTWWGDWKK